MMKPLPRVGRKPLRLVTGITLIAGSIVASYLVLDARGETRSVMVATGEMPAGAPVSAEDTTALAMPISAALEGYLTDQDWVEVSEMILVRKIEAGELLARRDFIEPTLRDDSVIAVSLQIGEPEWLQVGTLVEVWVAPPASENSFSAPFILSPEAVIERVSQEEGFAADGAASMVDIRVPVRDVPGLIHALANRYFLHLTPKAPSL